MASAGCDRRILRAFYTQYVAVLLILLTFCIGAYQRRTATSIPATVPARHAAVPDVELTDVAIENPFVEEGLIPPGHPELSAVAAVLQNHDVDATVRIPVARAALRADAALAGRLVGRAAAVERFMDERGVQRGALKVVIVVGEREGAGRMIASFTRKGEG